MNARNNTSSAGVDWTEFLRASHFVAAEPPIPVIEDSAREIVVADSSELVRRAVVRLLGENYTVHQVSDGTGALRHLERNPHCTLITALKMAPMDGRELLHRIVSRWPERVRKLIVMTGWPDPHQWVPAGVLVLHKPVKPDVIRAVVDARVREPLLKKVVSFPSARDEPCDARSLG